MTEPTTLALGLPEGEPRQRAAAIAVAAAHLGTLRPFRSAATFVRSNTGSDDAAPDAYSASIALVDVAEWIFSGLHPLEDYTNDDEDDGPDEPEEKLPTCALCGKAHPHPITIPGAITFPGHAPHDASKTGRYA